MKRYFFYLILLTITLSFLTQCKENKQCGEEYKQSIREWRTQRLNNLKAEDGWLNLAGLYWLEQGENTIGSAEKNDIVFPDKAPGKLGALVLTEKTIHFKAEENVEVTHNNQPVEKIKMNSDQQENPTILKHGSLKWFVIERSGEYGIRLRDLKSPLIDELDSIPAFPVKQKWKIKAEFVPFNEDKFIEVPNVLGNTNKENVPGILKFKVEGKEYQLYPLGTQKSMFLIFGDETNAEETYGGGRFLSISGPDEDNITFIDFNKAYNPPCAFTPYATCPLPPKENVLPVKIKAGEKEPGLDVPHH